DFGGGEMAEDSFKENVRRRAHGLVNRRQIAEVRAEPVHSRVDLYMHGDAARQLHAFGGILQHFKMVPVPDRGREIVAEYLFLFTAPNSGEKEDAAANSC